MAAGGTIVAHASAPGSSARALIRLSGPCVRTIIESIIHDAPQERFIDVGRIDLGHGLILPVLVCRFVGPASYTGEHVAEIQLPGNPYLVQRVIDWLLARPDVSLAGPGEFTARAFLNEKLSLVEAEGVAATIAARTDEERAAAARLLDGSTGRLYSAWADELTGLLALVEAGIDFTDQEDVIAIAPAQLEMRLGELANAIDNHLGPESGREQKPVSPHIALAGAPNAGKSTLFNTLLGRPRAVVSDQAGTTRDVLAEELALSADAPGAGSVTLQDLAGLDQSPGTSLDIAAQEAARQALAAADVVIHCDPSGVFAPLDEVDHGQSIIRVRTKADLVVDATHVEDLAVCALDGWHMPALRRAIADAAWGSRSATESIVLPRHCRTLQHAQELLVKARSLLDPHARAIDDAELVADCLRSSLDQLGELAGNVSPDDVIGRIFATFCVGK